MGNSFRTKEVEDNCENVLDLYVKCVDKNTGKPPQAYEEYCEVEKEEYLNCRRRLKQNNSQSAKQA